MESISIWLMEDGDTRHLRIHCYNIETGKKVWKKQYKIPYKWEPEGIQIYNYKGKNRIFIGFIEFSGYNKGIYYLDG